MAQFDWIPFLQGKYFMYYQMFAIIGSAVMLFLSCVSFVAYLLLNKICMHKQEYEMQESALEKTKDIAFNMGFYFLSAVPLICSALDVINLFIGIAAMSAVLIVLVFLNKGRENWDEDMYKNSDEGFFISFLKLSFSWRSQNSKDILKMVVISTVANLLVYKTCLCFYNAQISYYNQFLGFGVNTYFTRLLQLERSCPPGAPCHVYATVPEDPTTAFFLNIHTHVDVEEVIVSYRELLDVDVNKFKNVTATSILYEGLEWKTTRKVHSVLIYDLKPNTKYLTMVYYQGQYHTNGVYKTLPSDPAIPVRMINAGDSGYTEAAINLSKIVRTLSPDIFFMAGDIAYDDNMPACSYSWDYFLSMYTSITTSLGYMMPIVATIGNHDAGLNELSRTNITVDHRGPAFLIYFPLHFDRNADNQVIKRLPPVERRRTFVEYTFGNVYFLCLDSGYVNEFGGWQKDFMIESFEKHRSRVKFVNYHVPIYTACKSFDRNPQRFLHALFHWVPNFDKYKVITAFENHVHAFKRTKPLIGSSPREGGTVYLGDGAYGALVNEMCSPDASLDIFNRSSKSNNFWVSDIYEDRVHHMAYNAYGQIIDNFTQMTAPYLLTQTEILQSPQASQYIITQDPTPMITEL